MGANNSREPFITETATAPATATATALKPVGADVGWGKGELCESGSENGGKCNYPQWEPWQVTCTGLGKARLESNLNNYHGSMTKTDALKYYLNRPLTGPTPSPNVGSVINLSRATYSPENAGAPKATVDASNVLQCFPKWKPWTKECTGYEKASYWSQLDNVYPYNDDGKLAALKYCLDPTTSGKCGNIASNNNVPSFPRPTTVDPLKPPPMFDPSNRTLLEPNHAFNPQATLHAINIKECKPTWETNKGKERYAYGIAQYQPKMVGGSKDSKKWQSDCEKMLRNVSFTSGDGYTWSAGTANQLCEKDGTCNKSLLDKTCNPASAFDIRGKFLKLDPEYATASIFDWIGSPIDTGIGIIRYNGYRVAELARR